MLNRLKKILIAMFIILLQCSTAMAQDEPDKITDKTNQSVTQENLKAPQADIKKY